MSKKNKTKYREIIITQKDFDEYGIDDHYDLDVLINDIGKGGGSKKPKEDKGGGSKRRRRKKPKDKKAFSLGTKKGINPQEGPSTGRIIKGLASTTHKDRARDVITTEALKEAEDDLVQEGANTVFLNHDTDKAIGRVLRTKATNNGLEVEIMISKAESVNDVWTQIKEKVLNSFSIRLRPKRIKVLENEDTGQIEEFQILSMELFEVSVVGLPMNAKAAITEVIEKSFNKSIRNINKKKGSSKMPRNSRKKSKSSKRKSAAPVTAEQVADMIGEAVTPLAESMKALAESLNGSQKKSEKTASKKKSKKSAPADPMLEVLKQMQETNAQLAKSLKRSNRRKGGMGEGGDTGTGIPMKKLENASDEETVKFVHFACNNSEVYKNLSEDEKLRAKGIYIQMMDAAQAVG
jgi:HK97 family phage prohead protease